MCLCLCVLFLFLCLCVLCVCACYVFVFVSVDNAHKHRCRGIMREIGHSGGLYSAVNCSSKNLCCGSNIVKPALATIDL